jgi:hypothetical protein
MQEYQVTVNGARFDLDRPLFVLATQNPIEQEGTYPLPEAQLDRFMFNVVIEYPTEDEERRILAHTTGNLDPPIDKVASGEEIERMHSIVRDVPAAENVIDYAARLVRATRPVAGENTVPDFVRKWVRWGAGPGPARPLLLGAKAARCSKAAAWSSLEDVRAVALPVLRHRVLLNFQAEADEIDADAIVGSCSTRSGSTHGVAADSRSPRAVARSRISSSWRGRPSTAPSPACTAARSTATAPSSASTVHYRPGDDLKYVDWKLFARPIASTRSSSAKRRISSRTSPSMPAVDGVRRGQRRVEARVRRLLAAAVANLLLGRATGSGSLCTTRPSGNSLADAAADLTCAACSCALEAGGLRPDLCGSAVEAGGRAAEAARADLRVLGSLRRRRRARRRTAPRIGHGP